MGAPCQASVPLIKHGIPLDQFTSVYSGTHLVPELMIQFDCTATWAIGLLGASVGVQAWAKAFTGAVEPLSRALHSDALTYGSAHRQTLGGLLSEKQPVVFHFHLPVSRSGQQRATSTRLACGKRTNAS